MVRCRLSDFALAAAIGFCLYAAALWRWPWLWLVLLPTLLPLFDLAPRSGRFFFDEFDALILLTVGVLALRQTDSRATLSRTTQLILALLCLSYILSSLIRLWPAVPITADSFANYASPYNSLRVAKGFVWALLLVMPLRQAFAQFRNTRLLLGLGFLGGLAAVALVSLYERWLFTGVLTFVTDYRTTASFSSMHTGDGHIDVWLAMTMPLLGLLLIQRNWLKLLPLTIGLTLLSLYALLVTESRGPTIAVAVAWTVELLAWFATRSHQRGRMSAVVLSLAGVFLLGAATWPLLTQTSLGQRFLQINADAQTRLTHWQNSLALRDPTILTQAIGMGLGSFPAMHQQRSVHEPRATRYQFVVDGAQHYLTLWSGQTLYMGQAISAQQNSIYHFSVRVRTSEPHASFTVAWCELWMLYSRDCTWDSFSVSPRPGQWQTLQRTIFTKQVGSGRDLFGFNIHRPTRLSFFVEGAPTSGIDVTDLSLEDWKGRELLANGDFSHGSDDWFWAVDDHLMWHTKNLAVNILFDQGWLGILAVAGLLAACLVSLARQIDGGDQLAAVYLAALTGFIVTGVSVSTFDQPRLALAFYLMCFAILIGQRAESELKPALETAHNFS